MSNIIWTKIKELYSLKKNFGIQFVVKLIWNYRNYEYRYKLISKILKTNYANIINQPDAENQPVLVGSEYTIWVFWWQGLGAMPPVVKLCFESLKRNSADYKVCLIDKYNYNDYVEIPAIILEKLHSESMTITHFSDILRFHLLYQYGGLWIDATVLVLDNLTNHPEMFGLFYTPKFYKNRNFDCEFNYSPSFGRWAGFLLGTNLRYNPLFFVGKEVFTRYWSDYDGLINYLLIDFIIDMAYESIPFVKKEIDDIQPNNINIYQMINYINAEYTEEKFNSIKHNSFLFKLSWKTNIEYNKKGTIYQKLKTLNACE